MKLPELKEKILPLAKDKKNLQLRPEIHIPDVEKTVNSYISYLEANSGKRAYAPYYYNLMEIYKALSR